MINSVKYLRSLIGLVLVLVVSSCVVEPETYDKSLDNGTYTGSFTVYDGPGTSADIVDRVCPEVAGTLTISDDSGSINFVDTYPNYVHVGGVVTNHTGDINIYDNNKFTTTQSWAIEETDVQLEDLMNLKVCEATPPATPGNTATGDRGLLQDFALQVDSTTGFQGEFGQGQARGTLIYGVRCTDSSFVPICVYFMQMSKN